MLLTGIDANDLFSFELLSMRLNDGLNVVVGQNDVGKSNMVRLVRLVRDMVASSEGTLQGPQGYGFEKRFVRLGGPGFGRVSIGVRFDQEHERALLLLLVRAIAAQYGESQTNQPRLPDEWVALHSRIASFVEANLDMEAITDLFEGRLVMALDSREPARWALAYEFDHKGATYHLGIQGQGSPTGLIYHGKLDMDRASYSAEQPKLTGKLDPLLSTWSEISFDDLLPPPSQGVVWSFQTSNSGIHRPLTLQLARALGLASDYSRIPSTARVLSAIVGRSIFATENLRRPPRRQYALEEINGPVATEDAGNLPLVLYQNKNGDEAQRGNFRRLQEDFLQMTGRNIDLEATIVVGPNVDVLAELDVSLQVESTSGWVAIEQAGAGLWEALVALSAVVGGPGQVVFLDEPAVNLHSSWQLDLLRYLRPLHQVVIITHSPFLVPVETLEDFERVVRLVREEGRTVAVGIGQTTVPEGWRERWRQILVVSADSRAALFARGVLLVEGDTEIGAFRQWFNDESVVGSDKRGADARNVAIISVDGDRNFDAYVSYLERMRIPWAILCDGPAMDPDYKNGLITSFSVNDETGERPTEVQGPQPSTREFEDWKTYWATNGVYTLAKTFGVSASGEARPGDSASSGEIESFFRRIDEKLWIQLKSGIKSKPRRGFRFAEECDLNSHRDALEALQDVWRQIIVRLDAQTFGA